MENHKFVEVYYFVEVKSQNCDSNVTKLWSYTKKVAWIFLTISVISQFFDFTSTKSYTATNLWFSSNLCHQAFRYIVSSVSVSNNYADKDYLRRYWLLSRIVRLIVNMSVMSVIASIQKKSDRWKWHFSPSAIAPHVSFSVPLTQVPLPRQNCMCR